MYKKGSILLLYFSLLCYTLNIHATALPTIQCELNDSKTSTYLNTNDLTQEVEVIIELDTSPLLANDALHQEDPEVCFTSENIKAYERKLLDMQKELQTIIITKIYEDAKFKYSYKNIINGFCANVRLADIDKIKALPGVSNVYESISHKIPTSTYTTSTDSINYNLPHFWDKDLPYNGEGMVVAVLDTEFDITHELLTLSPNTEFALSKSDISDSLSHLTLSTSEDISIDNVYKSTKIPFAYDYANHDSNTSCSNYHGTHVLGILGANNYNVNSQFNGIAPEAQLLALKVYNDDGTCSDAAICAAIEDAITLGADVINISSGLSAGFSAGFTNTPSINYTDVFNLAANAGITIVCASGNVDRVGTGSYYFFSDKISAPLATNPDYGVISTPAVLPTTFAVASCSNAKIPSSYSSWGVANNLSIKPEIIAPGDDIYSILPNNAYGINSGTSMSAPCISGLSLLTNQYLNSTSRFNDYSLTRNSLIKTLLMNTSNPLIDKSTDLPYSPRLQGAGLVNPSAIFDTNVLIYSASDQEPKVTLGSNLSNSFSFDIVLQNFSDKCIIFHPSASIFTDDYTNFQSPDLPNFVASSSYNLNDARITVSDATQTISILPNSSNITDASIKIDGHQQKTISINITLPTSDINALKQVFSNGLFIEGYIQLISPDNVTLSIPYVGFYGDWDKAPIFDQYIYDSNYFYVNQFATTTIMQGGKEHIISLGNNPYMPNDSRYNSKLIAISPNNDQNGDEIGLNINLLRNAFTLTRTIYDENMMAVYTDTLTPGRKTYFFTSQNTYYAPPLKLNLPDGKYYYELTATIEYPNAKPQTLTLPFTIDTEKPQLLNSFISTTSDSRTLTVSTHDNNYILLLMLYDESGNYKKLIPIPASTTLLNLTQTFDITNINSDYLYLTILDYAMNQSTTKIDLKSNK